MQPTPVSTRPDHAARRATAAALLFAVLAVVLGAWYLNDLQLVKRTAQRVDAGQPWTPEQRLERYVSFAVTQLRNPKARDLSPLVRFYYRWNPAHPGAGDVLRWGSDYRGACDSHSRVVLAMLRASGVPSRPLEHQDRAGRSIHTVVEARIAGRWVVADPLYGIVFRRRDGSLATASDLRQDRALFLSQVEHVRGYDVQRYDFDPAGHINWDKIPVVLPAVHAALVAGLGKARVDDIARPDLWMWPQALYAVLCALLAAGFGLLAARSNRRARGRG